MKTNKRKNTNFNDNQISDKYQNPVMRDLFESTGNYDIDCKNNIRAYCYDNTQQHLSNFEPSQLKFIAGLWRVQRNFSQPVTSVRDKRFILGKKINKYEKNLFEYFEAAETSENCYGLMDPSYNYVVAKYDTDNGPLWAYGETLEKARAFLGIALFDKHIEMIHATERKNIEKQK